MLLYTLFTVLALVRVRAFYLPGVAPTDYEENDKVPLLVNSLTPAYYAGMSHGLRSMVSYDYYIYPFHFCRPQDGPKKQSESLGSILFGDRIFNSPFELYMLKDESCKYLCTSNYTARDVEFVTMRVWQGYNQNWFIDGLPAAQKIEIDDDKVYYTPGDDGEVYYTPRGDGKVYYTPGFSLGSVRFDDIDQSDQSQGPVVELNNHFDIKVEYHKTRQGQYRVVGVIINPASRNNKKPDDGAEPVCNVSDPVVFDENADPKNVLEVSFTYSVSWTESPTVWATRWDRYLYIMSPKIHWFSLVNSMVVVVLLVGIVVTILLRALRKDIARYNEIGLSEDIQEDSGWKLVHGDVFRSPKNKMLFSVFLGSGAQLFAMAGVTLLFALLGFLSPSNRGALTTAMILLCAFFGAIGGYVSAIAYKTFGGESWKLNLILTPLVVPGIVFGVFFILNFLLIFAGGSGAVPLGTMVATVLIWFVISVPLSIFGGFLGFKKGAIAAPVRTNQIPRQIPIQPRYLQRVPSVLLAGVLPFVAIFVELYFILNSIWFHRVYYMFGFLFVCFGLMMMTAAAVSVLLVYFQLCAENYHWQWKSFVLSGASAFYVFLYSLIYLFTKLSLSDFTSVALYLGYSLLISFVVFIITGTVGFICTYFFVRKIYASIKID